MISYLLVRARVAQRTWVKGYEGDRREQRAALDRYSQEQAGVKGAMIMVVEAEDLEQLQAKVPSMFVGTVDIVG